jgi:cytochrome c5
MKNGTRAEGHVALRCVSVQQIALRIAPATTIAPLSALAQGGEQTGSQVVATVCGESHTTGAKSAPKIGDTQAGIPRLKNRLDATVLSAANGHGALPARGGMAAVSDAELRNTISYMFKKAQPPVKKG